ncbi:MAG: SMI1/KNR4 family protein [Actinomycetaceae bacterium]|nr:SMI1/KNR4 family protein [Actinomycetaceae bacterium]
MARYLLDCASQVERIKRKLGVVRLVDYLREIFGADSHDYILGDPISLDKVRAFETEHDIRLPDEYLLFLTRIGHAGGNKGKHWLKGLAGGPRYGIYQLGSEDQSAAVEDLLSLKEVATVGMLSDEQWRQTVDLPNEVMDELGDEEYDALYKRMHCGILPVAYGGCTDFTGLIMSGPLRGAIIESNSNYDVWRTSPPMVVAPDFLSWYEGWLDGILGGDVVKSWRRPRLDQDEIFWRLGEYIERSPNAFLLLYSLQMAGGIENLDPKYLASLWKWYREADDKRTREYLLALLAQFDYENARAEIAGTSEGLFIHILATRAPEYIRDWNDHLKEMESTGQQDLIDAADYLRDIA